MPTLGSIRLGVVLDESADYPTRSTDKPVEDGSNVTDHISLSPTTVNLTCLLTHENANGIRYRLLKMRESKEIATYKGDTTLHNVAVTHVGTLANISNEGGYTLDLELKQIPIAQLKTYKVKVKNPETKKQDAKTATRVKKQNNVGLKPKTPMQTTYITRDLAVAAY